MADLIVIGYPDEATGDAATDEARRLARDLIIQPDAIALFLMLEKGQVPVSTEIAEVHALAVSQDEDQQQEDGAERQSHPQGADPAALLGHMSGVSLTEAADYLCSQSRHRTYRR